jgi:hypothetical protein
MEAPALLAEPLQLVILHEAAQLQMFLADAVALVILLLLPDILLTAFHLSGHQADHVRCQANPSAFEHDDGVAS